MRYLLFLLPLVLAACTIGYSDDVAMTKNASGITSYKRSRNVLIQGPGGTASQKGSNGYSLVTDNQQTARDIGNNIVSGVGLHEARLTNDSNNAKDVANHASDNAASVSKEQISADLQIKQGQQKNAVDLANTLKKGPPKSN